MIGTLAEVWLEVLDGLVKVVRVRLVTSLLVIKTLSLGTELIKVDDIPSLPFFVDSEPDDAEVGTGVKVEFVPGRDVPGFIERALDEIEHDVDTVVDEADSVVLLRGEVIDKTVVLRPCVGGLCVVLTSEEEDPLLLLMLMDN